MLECLRMALAQRSIDVSDEYLGSLGYAIYAFTYLEWAAICVADTLKPGYFRNDLQKLDKAKKERINRSAGQIAGDLENLIEQSVSQYPQFYDRLKAFHAEFSALAAQRNKLLHANPYTVKGTEREQRLRFSYGQDWPLAEIDKRAQRFEVASVEGVNLRLALIANGATGLV